MWPRCPKKSECPQYRFEFVIQDLFAVRFSRIAKAGLPTSCSWLEGSLTLSKEESVKKVDLMTFQYVLLDPALKKSNGAAAITTTGGKEPTKSKFDEYKDNLRDFQSNAIPKLDEENAEEIYKALVKEYPDYAQAHLSMIQNVDNRISVKMQYPFLLKQELSKERSQENMDELAGDFMRIIELGDLAIKAIKLEELLSYYGIKVDHRADAAKIKATMDKQKMMLIEAYTRKVCALGRLGVLYSVRQPVEITEAESSMPEGKGLITSLTTHINAAYLEVSKIIDMTDSKVLSINLWNAYHNQHWGRYAKYLNKLYEDKQQKDVLLELRALMATELQWEHVAKFLDKAVVTANPQSYRLF